MCVVPLQIGPMLALPSLDRLLERMFTAIYSSHCPAALYIVICASILSPFPGLPCEIHRTIFWTNFRCLLYNLWEWSFPFGVGVHYRLSLPLSAFPPPLVIPLRVILGSSFCLLYSVFLEISTLIS